MKQKRQIVLDTETTGLDPSDDHRIIEIGCVELVNRRVTGRTWHRYLNPDRRIDEGAIAVHGIRNEDLADQPRFPEVADEFLQFVVGAELVIHNAPFDVGFLEHELRRMDHKRQCLADLCPILDTLVEARKLHPGARNSLDALCKRYQVDNSSRDLHGALLDARLLGDVYLLMTGGQSALFDDADSDTKVSHEQAASDPQAAPLPNLSTRVIEPTAAELEAHERLLARIGETAGHPALWKKNEKLAK